MFPSVLLGPEVTMGLTNHLSQDGSMLRIENAQGKQHQGSNLNPCICSQNNAEIEFKFSCVLSKLLDILSCPLVRTTPL